jgi:predicted RecA/RadA family phage recombinase
MSENGSILFRRGPTADRKAFTPLKGEAIYDTDQQVFYVGDGQTQGGNPAFNDKITVDDDGNVTSILLADPNNTRPAPTPGLIRYNNETNTLEYSDGSDFFLLGSSPFNSVTNVLYVSPNGKDDDTFKEKRGRTPGTAFKTLNRACREAEAIIKNGAKGLGPYQKYITYDPGSGQQRSVIDSIVDNAPYKNLNITNGGTSLDATAELRSGFRVIGQTSGAIGIIEEYNVPGGLTDQLVIDVESGEFQTGEQLKFGSAIPSTPYVSGVQSIPEITIFVETGIYYEHFPIRVPVNTSIKGDEFRRSIIRPQPGMSNSPYADIGFKRDAANLDGYSGVEPRPFGRHYTTDYTSRIYPFIANEGGYTAEVELIRNNKQSLIDQTIAYISSTYPSLDYNETKCRRDAGLIIDGLVFDLEYGEYNGTLNAGLAYYGQAAYLPADQVTPTADSIDQLATYINNLLTTPAVETIVTNYVGGVAEIIRGNNFNQPKNNEELDVFLMNDATIIRNITVQQHGGFMEVLDPVGQIKTRSPYTQTASSFSRSKAPDVSFAGGMFVDGFCGNLDARLVQANSTTEIVIDSVDREPQAPTSFYVDGTRFQINKVDTVGVSTGQYRVLLDTSTPWDVAYYQIVNTGDPLPTLPLDIEILTAGNISMLSNDFTQINDLGYGLWVTNGARSEAVSVFTYYCHIAYLSENGADIRSLNGSCGYGDFALVARGSDPLETADEVNLSEDTVQIATVNTAGAFAANNQEGDLQVFVDGYSYDPFNVSEIEIDHNGAANADGDTFEIVRYEITGFTATATPGVIQLNIASAGNNDTSTTGLKTDVPDNTDIIIRNGQVIKIGNVIDVNPTRPSTALVYQDDPNTVYRVLSYDTAGLPANTAKVTLRETYDYVKPVVDTTAGSVPGSGQVGDTTVRLEVDLDNNERSRIEAAQAAGNPYQFGFNGTIHSITAFRSKVEVGAAYAEIDITPGLTKDLSTFSDTVTFRAGPQAGQAADITVGISTLRATSHDMLDIGSGSFQSTNYPAEIYGAPQISPDQSKEVVEENKGRVFFVTSDQDGNFRVGDFFKVDQGTGTVTFAASIALSNLDGIGFKRGVAISEFSTDDAMTDNASDTVPTESAVLGYVGRRLGLTDSNVERSDKIGSGFLDLGGVQAMQAPINMNTNTINNLATPTGANQATNKSYVDSKTFEVNSKSSTVDGSITLVTDDIAEDGSPTNLWFTNARSRASISVTDAGGDGSLSYNNSTGVITYTGPSAAEVRAHFSASNSGTGNGALSYNSSTGNFEFATIEDSTIRGLFAASGSLSYDSATGTFGFVDAVTSVNAKTGVIVLNTDDVAEGVSRVYFTNARFDTNFNGKDTDDLSEGTTNKYYTDERVDDRVAALIDGGSNISVTYNDSSNQLVIATISGAQGYDLSANSTDDIPEGAINLFYTTARAESAIDTRLLSKSTDDIAEGTNLYYTNERVDDRVNSLLQAGTNISFVYDDASNSFTINASSVGGYDLSANDTDDVSEGSTNLYYTNERVDDRVNSLLVMGTNISKTYNDGANTLTLNVDNTGGFDLSNNDTDDLSEGTNLYFTTGRIDSHLSGGTGVSYTTGEIAIGQSVGTSDSVTFNSVALNSADSLSFESGTHWITYNDGQGNFNIRIGNYANGSNVEESTEAGWVFHDEWSQSSGWRQFNVSSTSTTVGQLQGTDFSWRTQIYYDATNVELAYQGTVRMETSSTGIIVKDSITSATTDTDLSLSGNGTGGVSVTDYLTIGGGFTASTGSGTTLDTDGNVSMNGDLVVEGNLTVSGTTTTLNTETITLDDNIIVLNNNKSGAPGSETAGIEVERGSGDNVQLRWNDGSDVWELTTDGTTYETIATTVDVSAAAENDYVNSASFTTGTGVLTLSRLGGTDVTVDLDGRYHEQGTDIPDADISESSVTQHQTAINTGVSITESQISDLQSYLTSTITTNVLPDATANNRNLGSSGAKFNTVYATTFEGTATSAQYADLAEVYDSDILYPTGTAMCVGGDREVTACDKSKMCIGVISADPAFLMNKDADGQAVALKGRVPVRVKGPVQKGQAVYAWEHGYCTTMQTTALVGIALESSGVNTEKLIECVLKV